MAMDPRTRLVDENRGFRTYAKDECWLGWPALGKNDTNGVIVPNMGDLIFDKNDGPFWLVIGVDRSVPLDGTPPPYTVTLEWIDMWAYRKKRLGNGLAKLIEPYQPYSSFRAFFDGSTVPHTVTIDDRFNICGIDSTNCKLFKGTNTREDGEVISLSLNGSGDVVGENIDLVPIGETSLPKRPRTIYCNVALIDNDIVTLVVYTEKGIPSFNQGFVVKVGNVVNSKGGIRNIETASVYILDVSLVSNLLDDVEIDLIRSPINVAVTAGDFQARLHYSDGNTIVIPIDGNKCVLNGITNFTISQLS